MTTPVMETGMLRNLHFFDGIDTAELEAFSRAVAGTESGDVITLDFCNGGGSVFHGIAICDMMNAARAKGAKFVSNIWGYAASAACLVALSADEVYMSPNAAIMYHSAWCPFGGDNPGIAVANSVQQKLLAGRISKISEKDFSDGEEHWVTADLAHDLGIIDGFIGNSVNREDSENIRLAARYIYSGGKPMKEAEKKVKAEVEAVKAEAPCNEEEKKNEEPKAMDDDVMTIDVLEQMAQRLEKIEERLAALEGKTADGEGASDDAESGDQIAARLNSLYARLSGGKVDEKPVVATTGKVSKKAKMEASFERSKKLDLKSFM